MATKKAGGTARQNPSTGGRNLGTKLTHNELVFPGQIIVRQRGTKWHAGLNVGLGKDHTLFAERVGLVKYVQQLRQFRSGMTKDRTVVSIAPLTEDRMEEARMVQRRAQVKRSMLQARAHEAALFFPMPQHQQHTVDISSTPAGKLALVKAKTAASK